MAGSVSLQYRRAAVDRPVPASSRASLARQDIRTVSAPPRQAVVQVPVKDIVEAQGTEAARKEMLSDEVLDRADKAAEKLEPDRDIFVTDEKGERIPASGVGKELRAKHGIRIGKAKARGQAAEGAWKGLGTGLRIGVPIAVGGIVAAVSISVIWGSLKAVSVDFSALPVEQQYVIIAIIGICIFAVVAYLTWKYMGEK